MAKQIRFIRQTLESFAGVRKLDKKYGDITRLSGHNGRGKTTFGEAPAWIFFGTDIYGSKFNPSPTTYEFDRVYAALTLSVDGEEQLFAREINKKGTNAFYIDDVPVKAKEYDAAVADLFDKDVFLSLYNPGYFFTLHWTKQREQILRNTIPPAKSVVLAEMSRTSPEQKVKDVVHNPAAAKLDELTKKHSLDDLQKILGGTGGQKSKLEKQHIADQSRTKTLREQLQQMQAPTMSKEDAEAEIIKIDTALVELNGSLKKAREDDAKRSDIERQKAAADADYNTRVRGWKELDAEVIEDCCKTCARPFDEESKAAALADKELRMDEYKVGNKEVIERRKSLAEQLALLPDSETASIEVQIQTHQDQRRRLVAITEDGQRRDNLSKQIQEAAAKEAETLAALKESTFILDAIKAYRAKEAELQAEKVQALFTTLQIRLFKYVKTSGEYEPDFSIQMHGKDYATLSVGEKITAGLELTEVLFKQSELIVPTFVDGIGEYTGEFMIYGQLITAQAVKGRELIIETEDLSK